MDSKTFSRKQHACPWFMSLQGGVGQWGEPQPCAWQAVPGDGDLDLRTLCDFAAVLGNPTESHHAVPGLMPRLFGAATWPDAVSLAWPPIPTLSPLMQGTPGLAAAPWLSFSSANAAGDSAAPSSFFSPSSGQGGSTPAPAALLGFPAPSVPLPKVPS